jgi:hypothetical protein
MFIPVTGSLILAFDFFPSRIRISDLWVKKAPDPIEWKGTDTVLHYRAL